MFAGRGEIAPPSRDARRYLPARMVYAFLAFWILAGLGVFFVAMRGGPRGARESLYSESKAGRRAVWFVVAIVFAFGLVVPALVLAHNGNDKASMTAGGVHLNAAQQQGPRTLLAHLRVLSHAAATNSIARIGPNLDIRVGDDIPTAAGRRALVLNAILEGRARGLGQMPALLYQGKEAEDVASFVAAVAGNTAGH